MDILTEGTWVSLLFKNLYRSAGLSFSRGSNYIRLVVEKALNQSGGDSILVNGKRDVYKLSLRVPGF